MSWLYDSLVDGVTQKVSSKRVVMLMAATAMSVATLLLSAAALLGHDVGLAIGAVTAPLAGLGGYTYVNGRERELSRPNYLPPSYPFAERAQARHAPQSTHPPHLRDEP